MNRTAELAGWHPALPGSRLYVLTDSRMIGDRDLFAIVEAAVAAGADIIQYREKQKSRELMLAETKRLAHIIHNRNKLFIINDYPDLVAESGADGVHLGQHDMPVAAARKIIPAGSLIGISTHTVAQAKKAQVDGADYIGIGPVFATNTKDGVCDPIGLQLMKQMITAVTIPYVTIGGINQDTIDQVLAAGSKRVAVVSAVMNSENPGVAAASLRKIIDERLR